MTTLSLLILAGGRSRRMGQDKLWLPLEGVPLIERVVRRALPLVEEVLFSSRGEALPEDRPGRAGSAPVASPLRALAAALEAEGIPARIVPDLYRGAGPLAGIHAGLAAARGDLVLALAADMPFVNRALIREMTGLAEGFDAVVPLVPQPETGTPAWEPLHALYRPTCLPAIAARLVGGERRVASFLPDVRVRAVTAEEIARCDAAGLSFFNVNTPEDWEAARGRQITSDATA